jgi:hypothetical protein
MIAYERGDFGLLYHLVLIRGEGLLPKLQKNNKIHYITMILYLNYINEKTVFFNLKMFPNVCKHHLIILGHVKYTFKKAR